MRVNLKIKSLADACVTIVVAVAAGIVIFRELGPNQPPPPPPRIVVATGTIHPDVLTNVRGVGNVALVEFADFQCPFCGRHTRDVEPSLVSSFIDTGIIRHVFVNLPLPSHPHAAGASEAAACAGTQGKFWEMRAALFKNQASLDSVGLVERARELRLDQTAFSECLSRRDMRNLIERHRKVAAEFKIRATPAFLLGTVQSNGSVIVKKRINGALPYADFEAAINDLAVQKRRAFHRISLGTYN